MSALLSAFTALVADIAGCDLAYWICVPSAVLCLIGIVFRRL